MVHKVKITYPNRLSADEVGLATRLRCSAGAVTAFAGAGGPFCRSHLSGPSSRLRRPSSEELAGRWKVQRQLGQNGITM